MSVFVCGFYVTCLSHCHRSTTTQQSTQNSSLSPQHDHAWLDGLNSPLIQDEGDSKMLKLRFDVSQYTPEEIVVKTVDNKLL
ncbi:heat shock protein beta-1, partial [Lasius niger]